VSIVWVDSDIMVAALIEVIHGLTTYRVCYGKAWRAKEHTLAVLWGRLERSLHKSTKDVKCHITFRHRYQMCHRYWW
jgi:hypothetical protein